QLYPSAKQATHGGTVLSFPETKGLIAKLIVIEAINLAGKEPVLRAVELYEAVQLKLAGLARCAIAVDTYIKQKALGFLHLGDGDGGAIHMLDFVADLVLHAGNRRIVDGVGAAFTGGREADGDTPVFIFGDDSQTQLGFRIADPALAERELLLCQSHTPSLMAAHCSGKQSASAVQRWPH